MVWPIASIDGHNITAYYLQVSESRSSDGACGPPRPPSIRVGSLQEGLLTDSSTQTQISEVALPLNSRASEWEVRSSVKRSLFMRTPKLLGGRSIRDNSQFEWHQDGEDQLRRTPDSGLVRVWGWEGHDEIRATLAAGPSALTGGLVVRSRCGDA